MSDMNTDAYKNLLNMALSSGYDFIPFNKAEFKSNTYQCLLRHDIDVDLEAALNIATIEASLGIKSTFFFMLRSPVYNLMSRYNTRDLMKIMDMGHHVGLHFDAGFIAYDNTVDQINMEIKILEQITGKKVSVVSFHQPIIHEVRKINEHNFINTYEKSLGDEFFYISDSNMQWKNKPAIDFFRQKTYKKIQLLIHPIWWNEDQSDTQEIWDIAIKRNCEKMGKQLIETERAIGLCRSIKFDLR
jgi:hypothetical protein